MYSINRNLVIVRPKQPFVDWINRIAESEEADWDPLTLDYFQEDRTAVLVPEGDSLDEALDWLYDFKLDLFEEELNSWYTDPDLWPDEITPELFDEWFDLEVHSMVYDLDHEEEMVYEEQLAPQLFTPEQEAHLEALRHYTRQHYRLVWENGKSGQALQGDDLLVFKIMKQHPEYARLWSRLDAIPDDELEQDGVNPVMHIQIHHTVESQIQSEAPVEVREVIKGLIRKGMSRHQAIHAVGSVLSEEIFYILKESRPFDEQAYVRNLRKLLKKRN